MKFCSEFFRGNITLEKFKKEVQELKSIIITMEVQHLHSFKNEDPIAREKNKKFHKSYRKMVTEYKEALITLEKFFGDTGQNREHIKEGLKLADRADERYVKIKRRMEEKRSEEQSIQEYFKQKGKEIATKELADSLSRRVHNQPHMAIAPVSDTLGPGTFSISRKTAEFEPAGPVLDRTTKDLDPSEWPLDRTTKDLNPPGSSDKKTKDLKISEWPHDKKTAELRPAQSMNETGRYTAEGIAKKLENKVERKSYIAPVMFQPQETRASQKFEKQKAFMALSQMARRTTTDLFHSPDEQRGGESENVVTAGEPARPARRERPAQNASDDISRYINISVKCRRILLSKENLLKFVNEIKFAITFSTGESDIKIIIDTLNNYKTVLAREVNVMKEKEVSPEIPGDIKHIREVLITGLMDLKNYMEKLVLIVERKNKDELDDVKEKLEKAFENIDAYLKFKKS